MNSNIFKTKKNELASILGDNLAEALPPLFRTHRELLNRVDPVSLELTCSIEELAKFLNSEPEEVQNTLSNLINIKFIEIDFNGDDKYKIKIIVN